MRPDLLHTLPLGTRVTVRHLIEEGARATDAVGDLTGRTEGTVTVETRRGPVTVDLEQVVAAREVEARPWRIEAFLRRAGVAVLDLDDVVREFGADGIVAGHEEGLGLARGDLAELAFTLPEATAMVTGRARYADWLAALRVRLVEDGHPEVGVDTLLAAFSADHGTALAPTARLLDELVESGVPTFLFTNGTDRVPEELELLGLQRFLPRLLNSHDLGWAKPAPEAYAAAHAEIEAQLGRTVGRAEVAFTDDRPANVEGARVFGWQGRVFTLPP